MHFQQSALKQCEDLYQTDIVAQCQLPGRIVEALAVQTIMQCIPLINSGYSKDFL